MNRQILNFDDNLYYIDISLYPGVFYKLFGISVSQLEDRIYEISELSLNFDLSILETLYNLKDKIKIDSAQFEKSKPLLKLQLKALVARDLWEMSEYYQIMDADNESLQKAINILQTPGAYEKILK
jgi:hypothetical protein